MEFIEPVMEKSYLKKIFRVAMRVSRTERQSVSTVPIHQWPPSYPITRHQKVSCLGYCEAGSSTGARVLARVYEELRRVLQIDDQHIEEETQLG